MDNCRAAGIQIVNEPLEIDEMDRILQKTNIECWVEERGILAKEFGKQHSM